mgnify:FL=1
MELVAARSERHYAGRYASGSTVPKNSPVPFGSSVKKSRNLVVVGGGAVVADGTDDDVDAVVLGPVFAA